MVESNSSYSESTVKKKKKKKDCISWAFELREADLSVEFSDTMFDKQQNDGKLEKERKGDKKWSEDSILHSQRAATVREVNFSTQKKTVGEVRDWHIPAHYIM